MSLRTQIAEFMKAYSVVILLYLGYTGVIQFSDRSHSFLEVAIWVVLAAVGVYGVLTFIIIEVFEV
ncbi:MAG: hypothetical protein ABEJ58_00930 [Halodesulfurarchaeum sp.]